MKELSFEQMETIEGGLTQKQRLWGCGIAGFVAGVASGFNPFIGGLATTSCFLLYDVTE